MTPSTEGVELFIQFGETVTFHHFDWIVYEECCLYENVSPMPHLCVSHQPSMLLTKFSSTYITNCDILGDRASDQGLVEEGGTNGDQIEDLIEAVTSTSLKDASGQLFLTTSTEKTNEERHTAAISFVRLCPHNIFIGERRNYQFLRHQNFPIFAYLLVVIWQAIDVYQNYLFSASHLSAVKPTVPQSKIPEVDIDFDSFSESSGDCQRTKQSLQIQAIQKLLDELPLDCSTPKGKQSFMREAFDCKSGDQSRVVGQQRSPKVIQVQNAVFQAEKLVESGGSVCLDYDSNSTSVCSDGSTQPNISNR